MAKASGQRRQALDHSQNMEQGPLCSRTARIAAIQALNRAWIAFEVCQKQLHAENAAFIQWHAKEAAMVLQEAGQIQADFQATVLSCRSTIATF